MVVKVSSSRITGLRSGKPGHSVSTDQTVTPILVGRQEAFVERVSTVVKTHEPGFSADIEFSPIPSYTKVSIENIRASIGTNRFMTVDFLKQYKIGPGVYMYSRAHKMAGYGSVSDTGISSDLTFKPGKTIYNPLEERTYEVLKVRPVLSVYTNYPRNVVGEFVIGGEKEPL